MAREKSRVGPSTCMHPPSKYALHIISYYEMDTILQLA